MASHRRERVRRRRRGAPVPVAVAVAGTVLWLGSSGTLSSWTQAVLDNDTNTVSTANAVVLEEALGATECVSSSSSTNSSTCSTINKYGGTASSLAPGDSRTVDVTFTNTGSADGATFTLDPGSCTQSPVAGGGVGNACTNGDLTVAVSCSPGSSYSAGTAWGDLAYAAAAPPTATKSHTAAGGDLDDGATWTCRFTVALSASADIAVQGVTVSQPLAWTLSM